MSEEQVGEKKGKGGVGKGGEEKGGKVAKESYTSSECCEL